MPPSGGAPKSLVCFEFAAKGTCKMGGSCPHKPLTAAQYDAHKEAKRVASRAKGSASVCQFRRDNRFYRPLEVFSGDSPARPNVRVRRYDRQGRSIRNYEEDPSILAVSRNSLAAPDSIGLDMEDFAFGDPSPVAIDLDEFAFNEGMESQMANYNYGVLSDNSSRVSEDSLTTRSSGGRLRIFVQNTTTR